MKKHILDQRSLKLRSEMKGKRNFTSQLEILYHTYTHATHIHTCIIKHFHDLPLQPIIHTVIFYSVLFCFILFLKKFFSQLGKCISRPTKSQNP